MFCAIAPKSGIVKSATLINIFFICMCYFFKFRKHLTISTPHHLNTYFTLSTIALVRAANSGL